jgi:uncharacterized protein (TIGR03118 family)
MHVRRKRTLLLVPLLIVAAVAVGSAAARTTAENSYMVHDLVSDQPGVADHTDPNLVNAWGLDARPTSPWWVSDNGTDLSTLYTADGTPQSLVVQVPGAPTGLVANPSSKFVIKKGTSSGAAIFLFDTEDGTILGWNPAVTGTGTAVAKDLSDEDAIFKGLAISPFFNHWRLYATDFHNAKVDVFTGGFHVPAKTGFVDPDLPEGYAPFGIQTIGKHVFVTYALQDASGEDEVDCPGCGYVDEYKTDGTLVRRVASQGELNAPWGLAMAPDDFGAFSGDLLVGNFGDGWIHAYKQQKDGSWMLDGTLMDPSGAPIEIDGLWALQFGKGAPANGSTNTLFFTAGPDDESHGLFGTITASS